MRHFVFGGSRRVARRSLRLVVLELFINPPMMIQHRGLREKRQHPMWRILILQLLVVVQKGVSERKPRTSADKGPSMTEQSGYNSKRGEFEIEYDNDAEQMAADMEFKESDSGTERELKLRVLRIYSKRLDERKGRKDFVLEIKLLHPDPFEKTSPRRRRTYAVATGCSCVLLQKRSMMISLGALLRSTEWSNEYEIFRLNAKSCY